MEGIRTIIGSIFIVIGLEFLRLAIRFGSDKTVELIDELLRRRNIKVK